VKKTRIGESNPGFCGIKNTLKVERRNTSRHPFNRYHRNRGTYNSVGQQSHLVFLIANLDQKVRQLSTRIGRIFGSIVLVADNML
jgi:uncharacterized protein YxeA